MRQQSWQMEQADVMEWAASYDGPPYMALLCDPPYHLHSIVKRFGKKGSAPPIDRDGLYKRAASGFMNRTWDGGDIAYRPETWAALAEHLYPGAFIMAFASSRGWHRLAVAMEDANLRIHPSIFGWSTPGLLGWCYGSGFPKATKVKNAPDFNGHRYGGQALKPALEPIIVAQKPYEGRPIDCITGTGAGALNIEGGRVGWDAKGLANDILRRQSPRTDITGGNYGRGKPGEYNKESVSPPGRWPANFYLDEGTAVLLDEQSGNRKSGTLLRHHQRNVPRLGKGSVYGDDVGTQPPREWPGDSGGASRFFTNIALHEADVVRYVPKASRKERDAGLEGFAERVKSEARNESTPLADRMHGKTQYRNPHPTIKPINLTRWLATLLLPPEEYAPRRLLVPFAGAASEMIGAYQAGWEHILGIELEQESVEIGQARLKHWTGIDSEEFKTENHSYTVTITRES